MAYSPTAWADRASGTPGQFSATGAVTGNVTLALNDAPSVAGTPVTAARMNNIETGIATLDGGAITGAIHTVGLTGATAVSRYVGATTSLAPTSGTFAVGDYLIAQNGAIWICTGAGTPGTWTKAGLFSKQVFTSSGTFTAPFAGVYKVTCTGCGGSGGGGPAAGYGATAGAGGGTAIKWAALTALQAVTVTIGTGGTGVSTTSQATGNAGGTCSFGAICSATGGGGGPTSGASVGGVGSNGDINLSGAGVSAAPSNVSAGGFNPQVGGVSYWGFGYGAGSASQTSGTTAIGGPGIILVEWVG